MIDINQIQKFIGDREVLVVDRNSISRARLLKILPDFGFDPKRILSCGTLSDAIELFKKKQIGFIFSEHIIFEGTGFDLFIKIRELQPDFSRLCFFLMTSSISQSIVGEAVECEVDGFILKPYDLSSLQGSISSALTLKMSPSNYLSKIEEGIQFMSQGLFEEAKKTLREALTLHPKPALALSLLGEIECLNQGSQEAESLFTKGVESNGLHFRSLTRLYEFYMSEKRYDDAYGIVRNILKYYPANSQRFIQFIHLAVRTGHFYDMQFFYETFCHLENSKDSLKKSLGAGLYIAGKYSLLNKDKEKALKFFSQAEKCCPDSKILKAIEKLLLKDETLDEPKKELPQKMVS
jgi:tetratricopeptide (TPR) repeat protein